MNKKCKSCSSGKKCKDKSLDKKHKTCSSVKKHNNKKQKIQPKKQNALQYSETTLSQYMPP